MYKLAIIDDEESLASVLKMLIVRCGDFEVDTFNSVEDFFRNNKEQKYDIIFSDWNMPGIDGLEFSQLVSQMPNRPKKFVLMTGSGLDECELNDGYPIDLFLYKPFSVNTLKEALALA